MVERPMQSKVPSLFWGGLIGYGVASLIAGGISLALAQRPRGYDNAVAFQFLFFVGAFGAFLGCDVTARVRKRMDPSTPPDEFRRFFRSTSAILLGMIVIAGAFGTSTLLAFAYDAVVGLPLPRK